MTQKDDHDAFRSVAATPNRPEWSPYTVHENNPSARRKSFLSRMSTVDAGILAVAVVGMVWFVWRAGTVAEYQWQWPLLLEFLVRDTPSGWEPGLLLRGFAVTVRLGFWSMFLALAIGGVLGILSAHKRGLAALPVQCYVNLIRNTPPLVLLFLLYFFAGNILPVTETLFLRSLPPSVQALFAALFAPEEQLDRMLAAVITLGMYEGAYVAEIVRGGIESVPRGQWEASAALGFSRFDQLRLVILPQARRPILPPLAGQTISAFKDSALASLISLPELTFQSLEVMAVSRMTFEVWLSAGTLYLLLGVACARYARWLEEKKS